MDEKEANPGPVDRHARPRKAGARARSFQQAGSLLNAISRDLGLDRRLREQALLDLWAPVVGEPLCSRSRPLFIDAESKLVVAVADAAAGQELSMRKPEILRQLAGFGRGLGVAVGGLRFDLKRYHGESGAGQPPGQPSAELPRPGAGQLEAVVLAPEELERLAALERQLEAEVVPGLQVSPQRLLAVYRRQLVLARWMREAGYPVCASCQVVAQALPGGGRLCAACFSAAGGQL